MMAYRVLASGLVVSTLAFAAACGGPSSPASPSKVAQTTLASAPADSAGDGETPRVGYPTGGMREMSVIGFPPRTEPNLFFQELTALYRDFLLRTQTAVTYVDPEGENVWLTEYFRFYLNGCSHQDAIARTLAEIRTGSSQPVCGRETPTFPPRNLPNEFQAQLESTYRDVLSRPQILSYVDSEGANVWLAQYLRFRVSGCDHQDAQNKVFLEIRGAGVQPACTTPTVPSGYRVTGLALTAPGCASIGVCSPPVSADAIQLTAIATLTYATSPTITQTRSVTTGAEWQSSRPDLATVSSSGRVVFVRGPGGLVDIIATYQGQTARLTIQVPGQPAVSYQGEWSGTISTGGTFSFSVNAFNGITSFAVVAPSCGMVLATPKQIVGGAFTLNMSEGTVGTHYGYLIMISGNLPSPTTASGTVWASWGGNPAKAHCNVTGGLGIGWTATKR